MSDVRVSIASTREHEALNQLYLRWGYHGGIAEADVVYVARVDAQPVGIVRRTFDFGVTMLRGMQVAPNHQRQRVGSQLLRTFVADLAPTACYCFPFAHLTGFYGQCGFVVVHESEAANSLRERLDHYRAEGHSVVLMRREVPSSSRRRGLRW